MKFYGALFTEPHAHGENAYVGNLMASTLAKLELDPSCLDYLEIGPKHGNHTAYIDKHCPKSITLVELPSKQEYLSRWVSTLKSPTEVCYTDFLRFTSSKKFGLLLFCGVLYHNTEQLRLLKKLRSMSTDDGILVLETATCRTTSLQDTNLIEVFWPERYRGVNTIVFLPTKKAVISLVEMSGWDVIFKDDSNPERIALVLRASQNHIQSYDVTDINHANIA